LKANEASYIFATPGFYRVNPAKGTFVLGEPQVTHASIDPRNGSERLEISLEESARVKFWASMNELEITGSEISFEKLCKVGRLVFH